MTDSTTTPGLDEEKLAQLQGKVTNDVGGALGVFMAYIGDQTGVYRAMERLGPCHHSKIAAEAGVDERYLREWLSANVAFGYVDYDESQDVFCLNSEQAALFSHEGEPTCMQGFFQAVVGQLAGNQTAIDVFKTGRGRPWSDQGACCFCGTDRFFRTGYGANLIDDWIPALDGVEVQLKAGALIGDIGCGHGSSSILMARAFPNSRVQGIDCHSPSIETAKKNAMDAGVNNVSFSKDTAQNFKGNDFDFICMFDALHDMGDPVSAAIHIRKALKPGGTLMLVEPMAGDSLSENINLLSGIFYSISTTVCVPASKAQNLGLGLGAQAGEKRLTQILAQAGFSRVRRAAQTPTNMILEVKV